MADTVTLDAVEILKPGRFNGVRFTASDLAGIADAFERTHEALPPRLQLGHDLRQRYAQALFGDDATDADGLPALGWVARLYVKGEKLFADIADVPGELVNLIRTGAYRARSGGLLRDVRIGDKVFPWVLDHIALLGEQPPAVPGMADVALDRDGLAYAEALTFAYNDAEVVTMADAGTLDVERELLSIDDSLSKLAERIDTLTKGKKGNPLIKARIRGLREELRRAVKLGLAQGDGTMADPTLPGADPNAGAPATSGPTPTTADQLCTMLATKMGVGLEDYAGMWAAISTALDSTGATGTGLEGGDATMAKDDTTTTPAPDVALARDDGLTARVTVLETENATLKLAAQTAAAEAKVDKDIGSRSLPVGVRPVLVKLALEGQDVLYASVLDNAKTVPTAERGTSGTVNLASSALTDIERQAAIDNGYDPAAVAAYKAAHADG